jgi:hypothetical protein
MVQSAFSIHRLMLISLTAAITTACTLVEPAPGSEAIKVTSQEQVSGCDLLGQANTQVLDKVWFVERSEEPIAENLDTLAKNEAVRMGGNALVAAGEIKEGRRSYNVYKCP